MADYDFFLGEGDTEPVLKLQVVEPIAKTDPLYSQYPDGKPVNLTGASGSLKMRVSDDPEAVLIVQTITIDDPANGWISVPWTGFPGKIYNCRVKLVKGNGGKISFLNDRPFTLFVSPDP